jgi:hypothetical protein
VNEGNFESMVRGFITFCKKTLRVFSGFFFGCAVFSYTAFAFDEDESAQLIQSIEFAYDSYIMNVEIDWQKVREEIKNSVQANANPNAVKPGLNYSALEVAALFGDYSLIDLLLGKGAWLEGHKEPLWKGTPLLQSAGRGQTDIVACLLAYGANVEATNFYNYNSCELASFLKHESTTKLLKNYIEKNTAEEKKLLLYEYAESKPILLNIIKDAFEVKLQQQKLI